MQFDPISFEYNETPDIEIGDGAVGKLNILVYAVISISCVYYLLTQWSPAPAMGPVPKTADTNALS